MVDSWARGGPPRVRDNRDYNDLFDWATGGKAATVVQPGDLFGKTRGRTIVDYADTGTGTGGYTSGGQPRQSIDYAAPGQGGGQGIRWDDPRVPGWMRQWSSGGNLGAAQAANSRLVYDGWDTGYTLPVAYDPSRDSARLEVYQHGAPQAETGWERAMRFTQGYMQRGYTFDQAYNFALGRLARDEAATGNQGLGFDFSKIDPNSAQYNDRLAGPPGAPTAPQTGGTTVPAPYNGNSPKNDGSIDYRGDGVYPPAQAQTTTSTTPATTSNGSAFGGLGQYNLLHPELVVRDILQQHGYQPGRHTGMGDFLNSLLSKIVPTAMDLYMNPDGTPSLDSLANAGDKLGGLFFGGNGTMFQNLANYSQQAVKGLAPYMTGANVGLGRDEQEKLLRSATALGALGQNPYQKSAIMDLFDQGTENYDYGQRQGAATGKPADQTLWEWLLANRPGMLPAAR